MIGCVGVGWDVQGCVSAGPRGGGNTLRKGYSLTDFPARKRGWEPVGYFALLSLALVLF